MLLHRFLGYTTSGKKKKSCVFLCSSAHTMTIFFFLFLWLLLRFSLRHLHSINHLNTIHLGVVLFLVPGVHGTSLSVGLWFQQVRKVFDHYFLEYIFLHAAIFENSNYSYIWLPEGVPQLTDAFHIFLFFLCFILHGFYYYAFKFIDHFFLLQCSIGH